MLTLTNERLAEIVSKEAQANDYVNWRPEDLANLNITLRAMRLTSGVDSYFIDATMPRWLYVAIVDGLAPKPVTMNDKLRGPVLIPRNSASGAGSRGVTFSVCEAEEFTLVDFSSSPLSPEQIAEVFPPAVNPDKGVVISANAPPFMVAAISVAYASSVCWVANTVLNDNPVVSISRDPSRPLGSPVDGFAVHRAYLKAKKIATPWRGDAWVFYDGMKDRPGIIMSPDKRNIDCDDVLIVPTTTQPKHLDWALFAPMSETGLDADSYAKFTNISRVSKDNLRKRISTVSPSFMERLTDRCYSAISDVA